MIGLGINRRRFISPYDSASREFFARAGVIDPMVKRRHDRVVRHLKSTGIWDSLYLWYGADVGSLHDIGSGILSPAANGETIRRLLNRRGDYSHQNQSTSTRQPILDTGGGINGLPAIIPDAIDDGMIASVSVMASPFTVCFFGTSMGYTGSIGNRNLFITENPPPTQSRLRTTSGSPTFRPGYYNGTTASEEDTGISSLGSKLVTAVYNGASSAFYATGSNPVLFSIPSVSINNFHLFSNGAASQFAGGAYSHIFLFQGALSEAQHSALDSLLFSL